MQKNKDLSIFLSNNNNNNINNKNLYSQLSIDKNFHVKIRALVRQPKRVRHHLQPDAMWVY